MPVTSAAAPAASPNTTVAAGGGNGASTMQLQAAAGGGSSSGCSSNSQSNPRPPEKNGNAAAAASCGGELKAVIVEKPGNAVVKASVETTRENQLIERPKRISFGKVAGEESEPASKAGLNISTGGQVPRDPAAEMAKKILPKKEESPETPCRQCQLLEEDEAVELPKAVTSSAVVGHNGGQEFFGSSEECCSSWSGCCNSSCAGSIEQPQQPLSASVVVMQQQQQDNKPFKTSSSASAAMATSMVGVDHAKASTGHVATISCPQFESNRLSKISRSVPDDLPGEMELEQLLACATQEDGANQRHLLTFVTPSMETIPLEMCQDIPDVLI